MKYGKIISLFLTGFMLVTTSVDARHINKTRAAFNKKHLRNVTEKLADEAQYPQELPHKIIWLVSPPRSLSTALTRSVYARGDFQVMIEPSLRISRFGVANRGDFNPAHPDLSAPKNFPDLKKAVFTKVLDSHIFIKDIGSSVKNFLSNDPDLLKNKDVHFVFLVRDPHHSVLSMYKKQAEQGIKRAERLDAISRMIGYRSCYELFATLEEKAENKPVVLVAEDLYLNSEATLKELCAAIQIPYSEDMLHWEELGDDFTGEEWCMNKKPKAMHIWHDDAIKSTGFKMPSQYAVDKFGNPTFAEVSDPKRRELWKAVYLENLKPYENFFNKNHQRAIFLGSGKP